MACALTQGIPLDCNDSVGGIKTLYVTELSNKNAITPTSGATITTFTLTTGKQFWEYQVDVEVAKFNDNPTTNRTNGTLFYDESIEFSIKKLDSTKRAELYNLAKNRIMCIVLDNNGKYWLLGEVTGLMMDTSEVGSGQALGDMNGYSLKFSGKQAIPAREVSSTLITTLTAPAS